MDRDTVAVYEANAGEYRRRRKAYDPDRAERFATALAPGALRLDLGCGPGLYAPLLGRPLVAADAALAMCRETRRWAPEVPAVRHDLTAPPFRSGSFGGVWAWKCLQHVPARQLPGALAQLHRALALGGRVDLAVFRSGTGVGGEGVSAKDDDFPGRLFAWWEPEPFRQVLVGAGFTVEDLAVTDNTVKVTATRARSLPDIVGPDLRLLVCGLNPSLYSADAGVPFARPGNRFWPAAVAAGIVTVDRDPWGALAHHGVGFTDLVKRATVGAAQLSREEYRDGFERLAAVCELLRPAAVAFLGLTGWRAATGDRRAVAGWQPLRVGPTPAYLLPNPSGLNAHTTVAEVAGHLRAAALPRPLPPPPPAGPTD